MTEKLSVGSDDLPDCTTVALANVLEAGGQMAVAR